MIPKKIHYIWLGGNPLPPLTQKCIESWKKHCPDYEIIEWNESNFNIAQNQYCKDAIANKKWAFVSDFIRLKVLYDHGGIYMDTDVELIKPLDNFLNYDIFTSFENDNFLPTGLLASKKQHEWLKYLLSYYDDATFINDDGSFNLTTNVVTITNMTIKMYPELQLNNQTQIFNNIAIFSNDYFSPVNYESGRLYKTKNTHAIHWFAGSWLPKRTFKQKTKRFIKRILGKKNTERILAIINKNKKSV